MIKREEGGGYEDTMGQNGQSGGEREYGTQWTIWGWEEGEYENRIENPREEGVWDIMDNPGEVRKNRNRLDRIGGEGVDETKKRTGTDWTIGAGGWGIMVWNRLDNPGLGGDGNSLGEEEVCNDKKVKNCGKEC